MDIQQELITEYDRETANTRKMFEAIPADVDFTFKPHAKSMSLGQLAGHLSDTTGEWAISTLATSGLEFPADHKFEPYIPASTEALLEKFDEKLAEAKAELAKFPLENWDEHWKFSMGGQTWIDDTKYRVFRTWVLNHLVHHRAQLGIYLRLLNQPIPGTYGPSADGM